MAILQALCVCCLLGGAGCAEGEFATEADGGAVDPAPDGGGGGTDSSLGSGDSSSAEASSPPPQADDAASASDATADAAPVAPDAAPEDGGEDAGGADSGSDGGGTVTVLPCAAAAGCGAATSLAAVNGDESSPTDTEQGATDQWFVVEVIDTSYWSTSDQEKIHISLTSPPGADFDLYAYEASNASSQECSTVAASSTNGPGVVDTIELSWDDQLAVDDSKNISIYVVAKAITVCEAGQLWTLVVTGDQ